MVRDNPLSPDIIAEEFVLQFIEQPQVCLCHLFKLLLIRLDRGPKTMKRVSVYPNLVLAASSADEIEAQQLLRLPESFPLTINSGVADLCEYDGLNIHRQGLDMDIVGVRK